MTAPKIRGAFSLQFALLAVGLILIHHARYAFARVLPAEQATSEHVHAYLPFAFILVAVLVALAVALFVRDVVRARHWPALPVPPPPSLARTWAQNSVLLVGCYVLQETIEHRLAGEPLAVGGILFNRDGWIVLPLAVAVGSVVALVLRGARATIERVVRRGRLAPLYVRIVASRWPSAGVTVRQILLRGSIAGRAPPLLS